MSEVASAYVSLVPSAKGFGKGIQSQIGGDLDSAGKAGGKRLGGGLSSTFLPATKALAGAAAGIFAAAKIGGFLKESIAEAREAQKVGALTTQVIKSTGGAAKITAAQVGDLATAISNKTGMDDEMIQSGANMLLTFKNVKREGKGLNDVFGRATAAAADLSAAGFGDVSGQAKMLGKALNDPIKGIAALGRSGVTFSESQKKQIKGFVAAGKMLDAQKIILKEVESQVGGAAAASATGGEKLAVAWGNLKEQIGTAFLPVIDKVAGVLTTKVVPAISGFISGMQDGTGAGGAFVAFFKNIWAVAEPLGRALIATVVPAVKGLFASFTAGGGPSRITALFQTLVGFVRGQLIPAVMGVVTAFRGYLAVIIPIITQFVTGMMARIQPMMPQIRAIFGQIGAIIVSVMSLVQAVISRVTAIIGGIWSRWGSNIMNFVAMVFGSVLTIIGGALRIIQGVIKTVTSLIKGDWSGAWAGIKQIVSGAWQVIKGVVTGALNIIRSVIAAAWSLIKSGAAKAWDGITAAIKGAFTKIVGTVKGIGSDIVDGLVSGIRGAAGKVADAARDLADKIPGPIKKLLGIASPSKVTKAFGAFVGQGLALGMLGTVKQVQAASRKLAAGLSGAIETRVSAEVRSLNQLAKARESVATRLKSAQSKLASALQVRDDYAASIRQSFESYGNITDGGPTAEGILAKLRSDLGAAKAFQQNIAKLTSMGLSKAALKQVIDAGVEKGGQTAAALIAGGKSGVSQVNTLVAQMGATANSVATSAARSMYQAGVDSALGLVKGLQSQSAALAAAAKRIANQLVAQVKRALGIRSPSTVFASEVGQHIPTGVIKGIDSTQGRLDARLSGLVGMPDLATAGTTGAGAAPVTQYITTSDPLAAAAAARRQLEFSRNGRR